jgi:hypothetical protein
VKVGQSIALPRAEVQERGRWRSRDSAVSVGGPGGDAFEQDQDPSHGRNGIERGDEMHLRGPWIREADGHPFIDKGAE